MRTLLKCVDNGHYKQYEVSVTPLPGGTSIFRTAYGRIGGAQTVNEAVFVDGKAYAEYQKTVTSKTRKGYVIVEHEEPNGEIKKFEDPTAQVATATPAVKVPENIDGLEDLLDDALAGLNK